jgi:hypothetical protein
VSARLYASTTVFFAFNPQTGVRVGSEKINRSIRLAKDGRTFTAVAQVTRLDANGNVIGTPFTATSSGERMAVERIPIQP